MDKTYPVNESTKLWAASLKRLQKRLEKLTHESCTGSDEYVDCAVGSLQTQAMARALIEIIFESSDIEGLDRDIEIRLEQALEQALHVKPGDLG